MSKPRFPFFIPNNELNHLRPHLNSIEFDPHLALSRLSQLHQTLHHRSFPHREQFVQSKRLSSTMCPLDEERRKEVHRRAVSMQEQELKAFENVHRVEIEKLLDTQRAMIQALPKNFTFRDYERNLVKMKEMIAARRIQLEVFKQKTGPFRIGRMRALAREALFREEYSVQRSRKKRREPSLSPVTHSFLTEAP